MVTVRESAGSSAGSPGVEADTIKKMMISHMNAGLQKLGVVIPDKETKTSQAKGSASTQSALPPEALGSAKAPASPTTSASPPASASPSVSACFPEDITSVEMWSHTELPKQSKYAGKTYEEIDEGADNDNNNDFKRYRTWILQHVHESQNRGELLDYQNYLQCKEQPENIKSKIVFPGTTRPRTLRPAITSKKD